MPANSTKKTVKIISCMVIIDPALGVSGERIRAIGPLVGALNYFANISIWVNMFILKYGVRV